MNLHTVKVVLTARKWRICKGVGVCEYTISISKEKRGSGCVLFNGRRVFLFEGR
jgi:hypothetical protein